MSTDTDPDPVPCSTDPRAPHGFNRNASHSEDRYVCDCEDWTPPPDPDPIAWMWQHEETGRIGFVDEWQVANDWHKLNPRLKLVGPVYGAAAVEALLALVECLRGALTMIAAPMRPDGTWDRDRAACQQIAADALRGEKT